MLEPKVKEAIYRKIDEWVQEVFFNGTSREFIYLGNIKKRDQMVSPLKGVCFDDTKPKETDFNCCS